MCTLECGMRPADQLCCEMRVKRLELLDAIRSFRRHAKRVQEAELAFIKTSAKRFVRNRRKLVVAVRKRNRLQWIVAMYRRELFNIMTEFDRRDSTAATDNRRITRSQKKQQDGYKYDLPGADVGMSSSSYKQYVDDLVSHVAKVLENAQNQKVVPGE